MVHYLHMKNILILGAVVVAAIVGGFALYSFISNDKSVVTFDTSAVQTSDSQTTTSAEPESGTGDTVEQSPQTSSDGTAYRIGTSAGGKDIMAHTFGTGEKEVILIGGIHAGFAPSTESLLRMFITTARDASGFIPASVRVTVIPLLNPDSATGAAGALSGRLNANGVDLNRNFACSWQKDAVWQTQPVSGGSAAFSEPEAQALRDYIAKAKPVAVVAYYAKAGGVYASACGDKTVAQSSTLTNLYAGATGYSAHKAFDSYATSGDLTNWLAGQGVPAISVLLTSYTEAEFAKNALGISAVLQEIVK